MTATVEIFPYLMHAKVICLLVVVNLFALSIALRKINLDKTLADFFHILYLTETQFICTHPLVYIKLWIVMEAPASNQLGSILAHLTQCKIRQY